jgi:hypothetical protein
MNKQEYENKLYECDNDIAMQKSEIINSLIANIIVIGILTVVSKLILSTPIMYNLIASVIIVPIFNELNKKESLIYKSIQLNAYKKEKNSLNDKYNYEQEKKLITDKEIEQVMTITSSNTIDDQIEKHQFKRLVKQYKPTNNKNSN